MIRSMTGYGQASVEWAGARLTVELKSVNHRFADLRLRLPQELSALEPALRSKILARIQRGRIEGAVALSPVAAAGAGARLDRAFAEEVLAAARALAGEFQLGGRIEVASLLAIPGMFKTAGPSELDVTAARRVLEQAADQALDALDEARLREGEHLRAELLALLERIAGHAASIRTVAQGLPAQLHERLLERLRALGQQIELDAGRVAQEAAFLADRADVTEELVRLDGHIAEARRVLREPGGGSAGKRLDFLVQEIHRETNTIGAKSASLEVSRAAVELKTDLEKVREQVQNLE